MKKFKLQITPTITSEPFWVEMYGKSKTDVCNLYWSINPTHFIVATIEIED